MFRTAVSLVFGLALVGPQTHGAERRAGDRAAAAPRATSYRPVAAPVDVAARKAPGQPQAIHIFELHYASAPAIVRSIQEIIGSTAARFVADRDGNRILVSAGPDDLERVKKLISELDVPDAGRQRQTRIYALKHAEADELAAVLADTVADVQCQLVPDRRRKAIIVSAGEADLEKIERLIQELDVPQPEARRQLRVFHLAHVDADKVAETLGALMRDVPFRFVADARTNSIIVSTSADEAKGTFEAIGELIQQLDREVDESRQLVQIFPLKHADAKSLARTLDGVAEGVRVAVDERMNSIAVVGPEGDVAIVRSLIEALDEPAPQSTRRETREYAMSAEAFDAIQKDLAKTFGGDIKLKQARRQAGGEVRAVFEGPAAQLARLDKLARLERMVARAPRAEAAKAGFLVQVHCLLEAPKDAARAGAKPAPPFPGGEAVAAELAAMGMESPAVFFRAFSRVPADGTFELSGSAKVDDEIQNVQVEGTVRRDVGNAVDLDLSVEILEDRRGGPQRQAFNMRSTVRVPLGDHLIIGGAPHKGRSLVFVLRIDRTDAGKGSDRPGTATPGGARPSAPSKR